jgi:UDP-N-acetylglucosamine 2-epimerase (non-hydrolysing)
MRISALLFAPDAQAVANLRRMRVKGEIVQLPANTVVEALAHDLERARAEAGGTALEPGRGPAVVTMHRVENLNRRERVESFVALVEQLALHQQVRFVLHGPTIDTLRRHGWRSRLEAAGVELVGLAPHGQFTRWLHEASFVITDGGSIQEECALLGVPTLLWRAATERPDGLGRNVVLSRYRPEVVRAFLADPQAHRRAAATDVLRPSEVVLDHLQAHRPTA